MARKLFEPKPFHPGALVTWHQEIDGEYISRTGQVWSRTAESPQVLYVIPEDRRADEVAIIASVYRPRNGAPQLTYLRTFTLAEQRAALHRLAAIGRTPYLVEELYSALDGMWKGHLTWHMPACETLAGRKLFPQYEHKQHSARTVRQLILSGNEANAYDKLCSECLSVDAFEDVEST